MTASARRTVGVDVGGTKVLGVVADGTGAVLAEHRVPTPRGGEAVIAAIADVAVHLRAAHPDVVALGVGVPGLVDRRGVLRYAPNLPGVVELPVHALLSARTALPVQVDNDATCAAWGERERGAGRGADDCVLVTLGTGIGGGIVMGGRIVRGANGFAGEIGHMVVDPAGPACPCGRVGCWERMASGSGLRRLGRAAAYAGRAPSVLALAGGDPEEIRGEHVTAAASAGEPDALAVMDELAGWIALGLVDLVNLLDPELLVLGGGLVAAGAVLLDPVRRAFDERLIARQHRPPVAVVAAELGEQAGAIGAALLAAEAVEAV